MNVGRSYRVTSTGCVAVTFAVGTVLCLLFPYIAHIREAARRHSCANNLRQIGIALRRYHQSYGLLPPAAISGHSKVQLQSLTSEGKHYTMPQLYANWMVLLLPYLRYEDIALRLDPTVPITDPANRPVRTSRLPAISCPTDSYNRANNMYRVHPMGAIPATFARGNYAINGGVGENLAGGEDVPGFPWAPVCDGMTRIHTVGTAGLIERSWGSGIAGFNKSFSVQDFKNGLSNLIAIDEVRAGLLAADSRGAWALGDVGASITWWHGQLGDACGPNNREPRSDDIVGCHQLHEAFGEGALVAEGMPCCAYTRTAGQAASRSLHRKGANALLMDGSTRFFADDVDPDIWHSMHSRDSQPTRGFQSFLSSEPHARSRLGAEEHREMRSRSLTALESTTNSLGMILVRIPAGEFIMGLPDHGQDHDTPITGVPPHSPPHVVQITRDFLIGAHEVTNEQFTCAIAHRSAVSAATGHSRSQPHHPITRVSWNDAVSFCQALSRLPEEKAAGRCYRLPTEAEWEYCCRSGRTTSYRVPDSLTNDPTGFNMLVGPERGRPIKDVGSYSPNDFGLFDMRGNAWEWCADWYARDYYAGSPEVDPKGPSVGVLKVVRGADWRFTGMNCKYPRFHTEPWRKNPHIGFRVVCEIAP